MTHYITITSSGMRQLWDLIGECSAVFKPGVNFRFIIVTFFIISGFCLIVIPEPGYCQPTQKTESQAHLVDGFLELKIPVGFKAEAVDEPHIFKWTKDSSEIYIVVGERLVGSVKNIINNLKKAAATNKLLDKTRTLRISNHKGILIKEKFRLIRIAWCHGDSKFLPRNMSLILISLRRRKNLRPTLPHLKKLSSLSRSSLPREQNCGR